MIVGKMRVNARTLSKNGTVQRKVPKSVLWSKHDVDQDAGLVGRRYATRTAGSTRQYGMANGYDHLEAIDFLDGIGIIPGSGCEIKCALTKKLVAVARIGDAMAYKIAAMRRGIELDIYNV